jgi:hypothetical protein
MLILKLPWDIERPASTEFIFGKIKKSAGMTSYKKGWVADRNDAFGCQGLLDRGSGVLSSMEASHVKIIQTFLA